MFFYHIFQKSTPVNANPILSLAVTYIVAAIFCIGMMPIFANDLNLFGEFKKVGWASYALGFAIVGLELGFLMAYRAGWNISLAGIVSNIAVGLLLIPIGLLFFYDKLSLVNVAGIVLCLGGLVLINIK
ncbi:MAG: hypothetical protein U9N81_10145 [Bacillota bacterium]|nr:hypothetical protein [Bacillota bacterium]